MTAAAPGAGPVRKPWAPGCWPGARDCSAQARNPATPWRPAPTPPHSVRPELRRSPSRPRCLCTVCQCMLMRGLWPCHGGYSPVRGRRRLWQWGKIVAKLLDGGAAAGPARGSQPHPILRHCETIRGLPETPRTTPPSSWPAQAP
ncbi:hypothetical protein RA210_U100141 [Rubrivivax sp. A210]|nr:hypothetical protein RA210_U100141 [Rubrivivax sp. A210]